MNTGYTNSPTTVPPAGVLGDPHIQQDYPTQPDQTQFSSDARHDHSDKGGMKQKVQQLEEKMKGMVGGNKHKDTTGSQKVKVSAARAGSSSSSSSSDDERDDAHKGHAQHLQTDPRAGKTHAAPATTAYGAPIDDRGVTGTGGVTTAAGATGLSERDRRQRDRRARRARGERDVTSSSSSESDGEGMKEKAQVMKEKVKGKVTGRDDKTADGQAGDAQTRKELREQVMGDRTGAYTDHTAPPTGATGDVKGAHHEVLGGEVDQGAVRGTLFEGTHDIDEAPGTEHGEKKGIVQKIKEKVKGN